MTAAGRWPEDPEERLTRLVHDLRTPLTIVQGFAELLERGVDGMTADRRDEYLQRIMQAAGEMREILDDERDARLRAASRR